MNEQFRKDLELIRNDDQQYKAFRAKGNTTVIAGPGSGKTRVLTLKAVMLKQSEIEKPSGLALISYSRETVREIKKRLKIYGYRSSGHDFIGTVHAFSLAHVIEPFGRLFPEYDVKYPIQLASKGLEAKIYNAVLRELDVTDRIAPMTDIQKCRSLAQEGKSIVVIESSDIVSAGAALYEKKLRETEFLDFTAIINLSAKMIQEQELVRNSLKSRFPWLLIDEYQDLGKALHEMVLELTMNAGIKLFAVGDMNQSIYGFTGGYPDFLQELTENDDIETIPLYSNYRSSQHIITASLEALLPAPPIPKYVSMLRMDEPASFIFITCNEEMTEQYEVIARKVIPKLTADGISRSEIGILMGSNVQVQNMAHVLAREKIPFYISKWDFENSTVVVWLQHCASWCCASFGQSFDELFTIWEKLLENHGNQSYITERIDLKTHLYRILLRSKNIETVENWLNFIISELDLMELLKNSIQYPEENANLKILLEEASVRNLKGVKLSRFANLGVPDDEVTVTTRHSAKGLEFEAVIMVGMEENKFPNYYQLRDAKQLAESQRLCYVSVSRAKSTCILLRSKYYYDYRGDRTLHAPSRFWVSLYTKFGNEGNNFKGEDFS